MWKEPWPEPALLCDRRLGPVLPRCPLSPGVFITDTHRGGAGAPCWHSLERELIGFAGPLSPAQRLLREGRGFASWSSPPVSLLSGTGPP